MERAGNSDKGSITALYTVLVEGDDMTEPIADETRLHPRRAHHPDPASWRRRTTIPPIDVQAAVSRV